MPEEGRTDVRDLLKSNNSLAQDVAVSFCSALLCALLVTGEHCCSRIGTGYIMHT